MTIEELLQADIVRMRLTGKAFTPPTLRSNAMQIRITNGSYMLETHTHLDGPDMSFRLLPLYRALRAGGDKWKSGVSDDTTTVTVPDMPNAGVEALFQEAKRLLSQTGAAAG